MNEEWILIHHGDKIMTVADLIKKLQNYDQNTNVLIHCGDCVNDWYDDPDTDGPDRICNVVCRQQRYLDH